MMERQQADSDQPSAGTKTWADPMPKPEGGGQEGQSQTQGVGGYGKGGQGQQEMPEWKKHIIGGSKGSYGKLKEELVRAINDNLILIVVGETGSRKTTQMTQYIAEAGFAMRWQDRVHPAQ